MGIGSFFLLLALFCMSTISGAVVTVFLHEFGHLLARKICRWPTEYIRIPRRPKAWRTVAGIWGVELLEHREQFPTSSSEPALRTGWWAAA